MTAYFTNETCDPFTDRSEPCTIGNYNAYTVDATDHKQVVDTLEFSKKHNIRFVIRNTAHDFWGRSIGYGGLAVRMSNLKDQEVLDWDDKHYTGPALKMGAGTMGFEAQETLEPHDLVMVAGYCPSVGPAGGFVQGAGHSPLSTNYGLAADQTLEYEVITADGDLIMVSRDENSDLFWALNGGGAGTWAVVVSMTVRVYPMVPMAGASLFVDPSTISADTFWDMVDKGYSLLPHFTDNGAYVTYAYGPQHFGTFPFSAYNKTAAEAEEIMSPFIEYLNDKAIPHFVSYTESKTYLEHVEKNFATSQPTKEWPSGGRMVPREVFEDPERRAKLVSVMRRIVGTGALTSSTAMRPIKRTDNPTSAHPAWRDMNALVIMTWPWENAKRDLMQEKVELFAEELSPLLIEVAPDGGSYSNEADTFMPEWRHEMYGPNWEKLLEIKEKWDPEGVFYSRNTPGADKWHLDMDTGRMCSRRHCPPVQRRNVLQRSPPIGT
jgi:FAD/FMN-containing dehydrogenase